MKKQKKTIVTLALMATLCASAGVVGVTANKLQASAVTEYKTAERTSAFTFDAGASIRVSDPTGIRFTAAVAPTDGTQTLYTVTDNAVTLNSDVQIGMIVVPAQALANLQDTYDVFDYLEQDYNKTADKVSTVFEANQFVKNADGDYCIKGAIVSIKPVNYNYGYQAIAYYMTGASTAETTDDVYYYSAKSDTRTIAYVADEALNDDTKTWSPENITKFKKIITDSFIYANGEDYTAELVVGATLDLTGILPAVNGISGYSFTAPDGNNVATVTDSTLTAVAPGETTVTVTAYGGELLTIPVKVTYQQINVETDVATGLDLATAIGENVTAVTLDSVAVENTAGVVELTNTDASDKAKAYIVTGESGENYQVNAKIWSLIVDNATELQQMKTYEYVDTDKEVTYGYYKLNDNIIMTDVEWATANMVGDGTNDFVGIFDGCGYTITDFSVGTDEGLFNYIGGGAVIKNVSFENAIVNTGSNAGILSRGVYSGKFENISITAKHTHNGWAISNSPGILFGFLYAYNDAYYGDTYLTNVRIVATDDTARTYSAAIGHTTGYADRTNTFHMNNVTIIGFNNVLWYRNSVEQTTEVALTTAEDLKNNFTDCVNVTVYNTTDDWLKTAIELPAQELELDATKDYTVTVDFASMVSGEIKAVTIDNVAINGTSKTFGKTDASNVAKVCLIEMKDGTLYKVNITVWSKLIENADDLMAANQYGYTQQTGTNSDGTTIYYAYYGYFKMTGNANLTGKTWAKTNMIDYGSTKSGAANGFQGVFDGNGKTIDGLTISVNDTGLFNGIGTNGVIKNLTITNAAFTNTRMAGILVHYANGGLVENVSIQVSAMPKTEHFDQNKGLLFGLINGYGNVITIKNVTLTNTVPDSTYGQTAKDVCSAIGRLSVRADTKLVLDGVTVSGFGKYILAVETNSATIVGADCVITLGADTGVIVDADADGVIDDGFLSTESGLKDYAVIGTNGVTIDGVKITE